MDTYFCEDKLCKFFRVIFHPLALPFYLTLIDITHNPLFLLYALAEYPLTLFILIIMLLMLMIMPLLYKRWSKSKGDVLSNKEFLCFTLSMYIIVYLMSFIINNAAVTLFFNAIFKISALTYFLLWIVAIFRDVDLYSCGILSLLVFVLISPLTRTFLPICISLIVTGWVLSTYLVCQKTNYRKVLTSLLISTVAVGLNMVI